MFNYFSTIFNFIKKAKLSGRKIVLILAPSLGLVGQAKVAALLQMGLDSAYYPIVIGYKSKTTPMNSFVGTVIILPWGANNKLLRIFAYPVRVLVLVLISLMTRPPIIIGQGATGGCLAVLAGLFLPNSKIILSIHESRDAIINRSFWRSLVSFIAFRADAVHFVSAGLKSQYKDVLLNKKSFVIPSPAG